jgi:predicted choloylglycine hydrolase
LAIYTGLAFARVTTTTVATGFAIRAAISATTGFARGAAGVAVGAITARCAVKAAVAVTTAVPARPAIIYALMTAARNITTLAFVCDARRVAANVHTIVVANLFIAHRAAAPAATAPGINYKFIQQQKHTNNKARKQPLVKHAVDSFTFENLHNH